jgi:uncharacterized membrane protein YtjA (UPF0391 family)
LQSGALESNNGVSVSVHEFSRRLRFLCSAKESDFTMLRWAIGFAILALLAGLLGFGNLAGDFSYIARVLLFVFLVLFVASLIFGRGARPVV